MLAKEVLISHRRAIEEVERLHGDLFKYGNAPCAQTAVDCALASLKLACQEFEESLKDPL